jgi:hypothetical protein
MTLTEIITRDCWAFIPWRRLNLMNRLIFILLLSTSLLFLSCSEDTRPQSPEPESLDLELIRGEQYWDWQQIPYEEELYGIASSDVDYIITGSKGMTKYSSDGRTWLTGTWNGSEDHLAASLLRDTYIAVGTGNRCFLKGPSVGIGDALTYQQDTLRTIACSNDIAVAIGDAGELVTTSNGMDWLRHEPIAQDNISAVTWTGDHFLCGGENGVVYESSDGIGWVVEDTTIQSGITGLASTMYGIYAVTEAGDVWRQGSGNWTRDYKGSGVPLRGITGYQSILIAVGDHSSVVISTGAGEWKRGTLDINSDFRGITASKYIAVIGSNRVILASRDGFVWEERPSFPPYDLMEIATNGENYVAVGRNGIIHSPNGIDWYNARFVEYDGINSVHWAGDHYVACGLYGLVLTSLDGEEWLERDFPEVINLWSTHWTGSEVIIGGRNGKLWITSNYLDWEEISLPATGSFSGIAQSPDKLLAVTTSGWICVRVDGIAWKVYCLGDRFEDIIWTGFEFKALKGNSIYRSGDGFYWQVVALPNITGMKSIAFNGWRTFIAGHDGLIYSSQNLQDWVNETSGFEMTDLNTTVSVDLLDIMVDGPDVFIVGNKGVILKRK